MVLAVGCRFTDWSSRSWRKGVTFAIPPTRLIQLDIDPREIGKNYPVEVGAAWATRVRACADLLAALGPGAAARPLPRDAYFAEIQARKAAWDELKGRKERSDAVR